MMVSRRKCVPQFQCSLIVVSMSVIPVAPQLWCSCPTAVVQLPHNCGAVAPQLWGNGNIPRKNKRKARKIRTD